jgi:hypothetical protein
MSRLECDSCGDLVDVSGRTTTLPYICQRCTKDSALAIEAGNNIPCDATTYYIVEARSKSRKRFDDWFRSENDNTKGIFDDYSTALEAAEREQDGSSIEYRVVEYRREPTPCDAPYNSGVPCQSALDSVQEEQYFDPYCVGETDPRVHAMDVLDQFDADTELINGLMAENDDLKMKLSQANLNIQIQGEIIADLENTVGAYRVIFRIPGC